MASGDSASSPIGVFPPSACVGACRAGVHGSMPYHSIRCPTDPKTSNNIQTTQQRSLRRRLRHHRLEWAVPVQYYLLPEHRPRCCRNNRSLLSLAAVRVSAPESSRTKNGLSHHGPRCGDLPLPSFPDC